MSEGNKAVIRRIREEAVSQRKFDLLDGLYAAGYQYHGGPFGELSGPDAFKQLAQGTLQVMGDWRETVADQVAEGDFVATRLVMTGRVVGELLGVQGAGRPVTGEALVLSRFNRAGLIEEEWVQADVYGLLQQLGTP